MLKVASGAVISGIIGGGLGALLSEAHDVNVGWRGDNYFFKIGLQQWNINKIIAIVLGSAASALMGGGVSYFYFTPEGTVARAIKTVKSVDHRLLECISESVGYSDFAKRIQFYFTRASFPTIAAFQYLTKKKHELVKILSNLTEIVHRADDCHHLKNDIEDLIDSIHSMIPVMKKGMDLIMEDPSFQTKWHAHIIEELARINVMVRNAGPQFFNELSWGGGSYLHN